MFQEEILMFISYILIIVIEVNENKLKITDDANTFKFLRMNTASHSTYKIDYFSFYSEQ